MENKWGRGKRENAHGRKMLKNGAYPYYLYVFFFPLNVLTIKGLSGNFLLDNLVALSSRGLGQVVLSHQTGVRIPVALLPIFPLFSPEKLMI